MLSVNQKSYFQGGFTFVEMLIAMLLSSVMMVSIAAMYPTLQHQSQSLYRLYRLEQSLRQVLRTIEKDMKRAGFSYSPEGIPGNRGVKIGAYPQSAKNSCVLIMYDLNHIGTTNSSNLDNAEQFGYRWAYGSIEQYHGATDCGGAGWDKLLDPSEIVVTKFLVTRTGIDGQHYFTLVLEGYWNKRPELKRRVSTRIRAKNLT